MSNDRLTVMEQVRFKENKNRGNGSIAGGGCSNQLTCNDNV